jgi:hypothetical protein
MTKKDLNDLPDCLRRIARRLNKASRIQPFIADGLLPRLFRVHMNAATFEPGFAICGAWRWTHDTKRRGNRAHAMEVVFWLGVAGVGPSCWVEVAEAQVVGAPSSRDYLDDAPSLLSPKPMTQRSLRSKPMRDYTGLPFADWLIYPSLFVGVAFDDNVFQATNYRTSEPGVRLRPNIVAVRDAGIHKTTAFAHGDIRLYPDLSTANAVDVRAGLSHRWEARRDLSFRFQGEYDRRTDMYNNGYVTTSNGAATPAIGAKIASPQRYNQFIGSTAALKSFDRFFVGLGGSIVGTDYDALDTTAGSISQSYRNNVVYAATGRLGYLVTPLLYAFTEATGNFRNFDNAIYNSDGYRLVGGLGTDRISLFRGEVYAGYQRQLYDSPLFVSPSSPVIGGKVFWYPTRAWTVTASVDETFQDSGLTAVGNPTGSAARVTSALATVNYALSRSWSASVRGGHDALVYINGGRHDSRWTAGGQLNYEILRNLNATFDYSFVTVASNALGASFSRNIFSLGATYKY